MRTHLLEMVGALRGRPSGTKPTLRGKGSLETEISRDGTADPAGLVTSEVAEDFIFMDDSSRHPSPAEGAAATGGQLDRIATAAVHMASLGPRLASVAAAMEEQARAQARSAAAIAATADALVGDLQKAVADLGSASGQVANALETVTRISAYTRLLSINASIEAARAGIAGRSFSVVVDEVKRLADDTGTATDSIAANIGRMRTSVAGVAAVAGQTGTPARATGTREVPVAAAEAAGRTRTVEDVTRQVREMARSAGSQIDGAQELHGLGGQIKSLSESLLLAVGRYRFKAHARAGDALASLAPQLEEVGGDRRRCEALLEDFIGAHPWFEVAYVTDAGGRQYVDNVVSSGKGVARDPAGFGKDWSQRPWYLAALGSAGPCSTDIYRSAATGDYCFTAAARLTGPSGEPLGVVGADVNFTRLVLLDG